MNSDQNNASKQLPSQKAMKQLSKTDAERGEPADPRIIDATDNDRENAPPPDNVGAKLKPGIQSTLAHGDGKPHDESQRRS